MLLFNLGWWRAHRELGGLKISSVFWKALWWMKLYGKATNKGSPWSWSHQDGVAALSLGQGQAMMCWPFHPLLSCENLKITIWWKQCLKDLKINKLCNLFLLGYKAGLTAEEIRGLFSTFHPEAAHCCWMPGLHKAGIRDHSCLLSQPCLWSRALHAAIPMPWFPSLHNTACGGQTMLHPLPLLFFKSTPPGNLHLHCSFATAWSLGNVPKFWHFWQEFVLLLSQSGKETPFF